MATLRVWCLLLGLRFVAPRGSPPRDEVCQIQTHISLRARHEQICAEDSYEPSPLEAEWVKNNKAWTGTDHCSHLDLQTQQIWVSAARATQTHKERPALPTNIFSKICWAGQPPSFIEPLAGILRDPRFDCDNQVSIFSKDWLLFPKAQTSGTNMFFDAGGSHFQEALDFFTKAYQAGGTIFDKVFVWEMRKQGTEAYWAGVGPDTRAFWEPRVTFYDGVPVSTNVDSENNPVSMIYSACKPEDYCVFKLDIDTPRVELTLIEQLLGNPQETRTKVDELFFEHHVHGVMQKWWHHNVNGTFADSYDLFAMLRRLGVRAHSWV